MKEIKEERFTKKEDIGFHPAPLTQTPPPAAPDTRTNVRSFVHISEPVVGYSVIVPQERRKTRQSFDIFEDQYEALKKIQIAELEKTGERSGQTLGGMMQEALDAFIRERARKLGNVSIVRE